MESNVKNLMVEIYLNIKKTYKLNFVSDKHVINKQFKRKLGRKLVSDKPVMYNDKLQWLKLNWFDPIAIDCADKLKVRNYVEEKIGKIYLNDLLSVYASVEEIDINSLPNKFVLKGTHGSGFNIICSDKLIMDWPSEFNKIRNWLKSNYYLKHREWVYRDIKPRVICEKFLKQDDGDELRDYRFFCFNGEPKFITVDFSITNKKKTRRNLYDLEWNIIDAEISYPKETDIQVDKPEKLEEMIELSAKLSAGFPHTRIDFYYIENKIIFGEITFFHQSGMGKIRPEEFELQMGSWLKLPQKT